MFVFDLSGPRYYKGFYDMGSNSINSLLESDGRYKMIQTDHQTYFLSLEYHGGPRPFSVKSLKGDCDRKCFQDNKNFETEFHSLFVCKVSVGSEW